MNNSLITNNPDRTSIFLRLCSYSHETLVSRDVLTLKPDCQMITDQSQPLLQILDIEPI